MDCQKQSLFDFLNVSGRGSSNVQFTVPIYQRNYAWERVHCERLLEDIFELADKLKNNIQATPHFCGSIVYCKNIGNNPSLGTINNCDVVDGQQRLTTLSLIIKALHNIGNSLQSASVAFKTGVLPQFEERMYLSIHSKNSGFKLILHTDDNSEFTAIMNGVTLNPIASIKLRDNFNFITAELIKYVAANENNITYIRNALQRFEICWIELDASDNPQDIFETLNSLGKELEIGDLVRNFILMQIPSAILATHHQKWVDIEKNCGNNGTGLNSFISSFLVYYNDTNKDIVDQTRSLYLQFRKYSEKVISTAIANGKSKIDGLNDILDELSSLSTFYGYLSGAIPFPTMGYSPYIVKTIGDFRKINITTVFPFIMHMFTDYKNGKILIEDLEKVINFVMTHIVRKAFLGGSFKSLNSFFATLHKNVFGSAGTTIISYADLLGTYFTHNGLMIKNADFETAIINKPIYDDNKTLTGFILYTIENCGVAKLTTVGQIEHILPQAGDRSGSWANDLGGKLNLDKIRNQYAHTLGNLTLLLPNQAVSDKAFKDKIIDYNNPTMCKAGLLNEDVVSVLPISPAAVPIWNENNIVNRSKRLSDIITEGVPAKGSAKAIPPLFAYPDFTLLGKTSFSEIFAEPRLISKYIYGFQLANGEIVELSSKKQPLRELYNSLISYLYSRYQAQMDILSQNGGTRLLSKTSHSKRIKHIVDSITTINSKTAKSYSHIGNIYYYNNFSFFDTADVINNLLTKLAIPFSDLVIYLI